MPSPRPTTLGLLVDDLQSRYQMRLLEGARRAAKLRQARVSTFLGGCLSGTPGARFDSSFLFELATPLAVDGIISASAILAGEVGATAVQKFCEQSSLPLVSIGALDGFPWVDACNADGMHQVAAHAVAVHERTRFAFIQGPPGNSDSQGRESSLREALSRFGLGLAARFVVSGDFLESSGADAISTLLDTRRIDPSEFDCVVAANDLMAKGALDELLARGVRVPEDVIVIGFDDDDVARSTDPGLTTVAQHVEQIGARACNLLLDILEGVPTESEISVPTELVIRASCGCGTVGSDSWGILHPPNGRTLLEHSADQRSVCTQKLNSYFCGDAGTQGVDSAFRITAGFAGDDDYRALVRGIAATKREGLDPLRWHDIVRPFDDVISGRPTTDVEVQRYRERLTNLHLRISDAAASIQARDSLRTMQLSNAVRIMGSALVCASSVRSLAPILHAALPGLGVKTCFVCLFDENADGRSRAKVLVRHTSDAYLHHQPLQRLQELWRKLPGSVPPPSSTGKTARSQAPFPTIDLLPTELNLSDQVSGLTIHPLVFAQDALGYVIFEEPAELRSAWVLDAIAGHLSAAIYSILNAERLRHARELAERAYEAKSEFLAVMSHEIRTPMTGILGQLDLSLRGELAVDQRRGLELARTSGRTLLRIVNDLLDYSKIEAQRLELERVQFKLDDVWLQVIGASGMAAADKGLELVIDASLDVPDELIGDALRLGQVLVNLTSNAVKFSTKGDITLQVRRVSPPGQSNVRLLFSVSDAGIGLTPAQVEAVFMPFTQGDSSTTRRYGGTGLGLTISQRLVRLMGGELHVESVEGQGSTFSFETDFLAATAVSPERAAAYSARLLVVDDSPSQREAIERAFSSLGFQIENAADLDEARLLLDASPASRRVDLVLVDYGLLEASKLLADGEFNPREFGRWTGPVAVMAPHGSELAHIELSLGGRAALIAKPLLRSTLRTLAEELGTKAAVPPPGNEQDGVPCVAWIASEDAELCATVSSLLTKAGLVVQTASDGRALLALTSQVTPVAILLSPKLPEVDGLLVARALRSKPRLVGVPMLGIARLGLAGLRERCIAAGMNDFLALSQDQSRLTAMALSWRGVKPSTPAATSLSHSSMLAARIGVSSELDTRTAIERIGGDESLYRRLLRRFVDAHYTSAQAIRDAVASSDFQAAERQAHALASAAAAVGATTLHQAAHALELLCGRGPNPGANTLLGDLEFSASLTLAAAKSYLAGALAKVPEWSPKDLARRLSKLDSLLQDHDTHAVECVEELRPLLPHQAREVMRKLDTRIRCYDFEGAREQLSELARAIGVDVRR